MWQDPAVDTFAGIADERRAVADMLSGLTKQQQATRRLTQEVKDRDDIWVAKHAGNPRFREKTPTRLELVRR